MTMLVCNKGEKPMSISTLNFAQEAYPTVVRIANELAELEQRSAHDSISLLVIAEGQKKIDRLKAEKEAKK